MYNKTYFSPQVQKFLLVLLSATVINISLILIYRRTIWSEVVCKGKGLAILQ